jgi:plasmid maintenance system antidote protein VapI
MMAKKVTKQTLTKGKRPAKVGHMIRIAVLERMGELEWNAYQLAKAVRGSVTAPPIYDFVAGRKDLKGESINHVLRALGLKVCSVPDTIRDTTRTPRKSPKSR